MGRTLHHQVTGTIKFLWTDKFVLTNCGRVKFRTGRIASFKLKPTLYYCKLCNYVLGTIKFLLVAIDEIEKEIKENAAKM